MTGDPNVVDFFSREDCAISCEGNWIGTVTRKNTPAAGAHNQSFSFDLTIPGTAIVVQGTTTLAAQG